MSARSTIPEPAVGQVWESKDRREAGRRVRIIRGSPYSNRFEAQNIANPNSPRTVGRTTSLFRTTLRAKWRFIPEEER